MEMEAPPAASPDTATPMVPATRVVLLVLSTLTEPLSATVSIKLGSTPAIPALVGLVDALIAMLAAPAAAPEAATESASEYRSASDEDDTTTLPALMEALALPIIWASLVILERFRARDPAPAAAPEAATAAMVAHSLVEFSEVTETAPEASMLPVVESQAVEAESIRLKTSPPAPEADPEPATRSSAATKDDWFMALMVMSAALMFALVTCARVVNPASLLVVPICSKAPSELDVASVLELAGSYAAASPQVARLMARPPAPAAEPEPATPRAVVMTEVVFVAVALRLPARSRLVLVTSAVTVLPANAMTTEPLAAAEPPAPMATPTVSMSVVP